MGLLAVAIEIIASLVWLFAPLATITSSEGTRRVSEYTFNPGISLLVLIPVILTIVELSLIVRNSSKHVSETTLWIAPLVCLVFCVIGFFSVGLFHIPTAFILIITAKLATRHHSKTNPPQLHLK